MRKGSEGRDGVGGGGIEVEVENEREKDARRKGYELGMKKILYESRGFGMRIYGRSVLAPADGKGKRKVKKGGKRSARALRKKSRLLGGWRYSCYVYIYLYASGWVTRGRKRGRARRDK